MRNVGLKKNDTRLTIAYEAIVERWNEKTQHLSLIDVYHKPSAINPYYKPDFILKLEAQGGVQYLILDAKYSTYSTVRNMHIPKLFQKYYLGMAVYNKTCNIATNNHILGVIAIYSLDMRTSSYITYWPHQGIYSRLPRLPIVGGVGLMTENSDDFSHVMKRIFSLIENLDLAH